MELPQSNQWKTFVSWVSGGKIRVTIQHSYLMTPIYGWWIGIPQRFMQPGCHKLVCNLRYNKKPTAFLVSASAAVAARPQPRRVFPGWIWQTTAAKENMDRMETVSSGALLRLSAANFQFLFLYRISTFFQSTLAVYLVPTIHTLLFIFPHLSLFLPLRSLSCLPPPLCLQQIARNTLSTPYVSLPRQHCQQLEHITANCATCGPLKARKREDGAALCQWSWGRCVFVGSSF